MKKLQNFLNENNITFELRIWGDDYFDEPFHVKGFLVSFDGYLDADAYNKLQKFRIYMTRRKSLDCFQIQSGAIKSFRVLTSTDSDVLAEHDAKRKDAIEAFWKNRHLENLVVKPLHYTDYTEICEMDKLSGFSVEEWVDEMDENNTYSWGLYLLDKLIGYCTIGGADDVYYAITEHPKYTPEAHFLSDVFIRPEYRNHEYGIYMIRQAIAQRIAKEGEYPVFLESMCGKLLSYYEKAGFEIIPNSELCMVWLP